MRALIVIAVIAWLTMTGLPGGKLLRRGRHPLLAAGGICKAIQASEITRLFRHLFTTDAGWSALALRVPVGIIFAAHGAQKLFGWFGGHGLGGTGQWMASKRRSPDGMRAETGADLDVRRQGRNRSLRTRSFA